MAPDYIARLKAGADGRVRFPGAIYGAGYRELLAHAAVYVQATEVGGTHPALVEALGYGRVVCYNSTPENEEVAGGAALPFDAHAPGSLARLLAGILDDPAAHSVWKERAASACGRDIVGRMSFAGTRRSLKGGATSHNIPEAPRFGPRLGYVRC